MWTRWWGDSGHRLLGVCPWAANRPPWCSVTLHLWASVCVSDGGAAPSPRGWEVKGGVFWEMKET